MPDPTTTSAGQVVSDLLRQSWLDSPPPLRVSLSDLELVTPLLYGSGASALGWWRVRDSELRESPSAELLHQAYRLLVLQAKIHETKILKAFRLLRAAGIEAILIKGWAVARLYPQPALRPYGDIDLCVREADYFVAKRVVESAEARDCWVDLHSRIFELDDRSVEDLFSRSLLVPCGDGQVRVLAAEDQFALLAIHLLKHGAWRPLWLCDIGMLLESMPAKFDWQLCLGKSKRRANWILAAAGLAHVLLDAQIKDATIAERAGAIPSWLPRSVLKQWEAPYAGIQPPMSHRAPMTAYLRKPGGLFVDLVNRWPNPILATVSVKGQFNKFPRLPYQLGNLLARAERFLFSSLRMRRHPL